jgi:hypothetical protein
MKNAHLRFGAFEFVKTTRESTLHVRVHMSQLIAECAQGSSAHAHLASVFGGDQDVAAIAAAIAENVEFQASGPDLRPIRIRFGESPQIFRGGVAVPGRRRSVRHLIVLSAEVAATRAGCDVDARRTILFAKEPPFILARLADRFGLPVLPEWSGWMASELERRRAIQPLMGFGCDPVLVTATKKQLLRWIGAGLKQRRITIPEADRLPL